MPVTATVDLAALRHNVRALQARAGDAALMAVIKADAYGHGARRTACVLHEAGVRHFAVARPDEGIRLRDALGDDRRDARILVLGAPLPEHLPAYVEHDLGVTVSSVDVAEAVCALASSARPVRVHVKVDTGMGRIGLTEDEAPRVMRRLADAPGVRREGLWTHFATADEPGSAFAKAQLDRFRRVVDALGDAVEHVHAANTGALFTFDAVDMPFPRPLVRTGIALYGLGASADLVESAALRPVMRLSTRVTHVKTVARGTPVSYGAVWRAPRRTRVATLGAGYGDGYPRRCTGRAEVRIHGARRPVVGTICMDMMMVDLGPPGDPVSDAVSVGDDAVLFGPDGPTLYEVARWAETIPYEVCCGISPRVPRRYTTADSAPFERDEPPSTAAPSVPSPRSHPE